MGWWSTAERGPAGDSKPAAAEPRIAIIRAIVVTTNAIVYFLLPTGEHDIRWLALATIVLALAYAYGTLLLAPYRRWPGLVSAWTTAISDGAFTAIWVLATGGYHSPFYILWYLSVVAVSFRFGFWESVVTSVAYAILYLAIAVGVGVAGVDVATLALRCTYILLIGVVAGFNGEFSYYAAKAREEMGGRMRAAQESEARLRDLLAAVPDPVIITSADGEITLANEAAGSSLGRNGSPLVGSSLEHLAEGESGPRLRGMLRGAQAMPSAAEVQVKDAAGVPKPFEIRLNRVETTEGPRIVAVLRDLTERKRAEEERLAHVEKLKEFERLKELEAFRTQFINAAAHELGTPLTPIRMQVHMLRRHSDKLPAEHRRSLEILERNVSRLGALVQEVLDSARIQANKLGVDRKPTDINSIALEAVESFHEAAAQAGTRLVARLGTDMQAVADEKRLTQVLFNLIGNALKFTPPGGEIVVETRRQRGMIVVSVRDNGIGIRPEDQKRLFQPFAQINAAGSPKVGAGLGLYISRGLIELHGGKLWCESPGTNLGTTFSFSLPIESPAVASPPEPEREDPLKRRLRDLV